jgi:hypothetical protein
MMVHWYSSLTYCISRGYVIIAVPAVVQKQGVFRVKNAAREASWFSRFEIEIQSIGAGPSAGIDLVPDLDTSDVALLSGSIEGPRYFLSI